MQKDKTLPAKHKLIPGFRFALNGIVYLFRTQQNARNHVFIASTVLIMGWGLRISAYEWLVVVLCIGMVLTAELFNTAIESLTDLVSPNFNEKAGLVKDISAGGVLMAALASAVSGLCIFLPKIYTIVDTWIWQG